MANPKQRVMRAAGVVLLVAGVAAVQASEPPTLQGEEVRRFEAAEARQGVAVDADHFYVIDNAAIGKYDKTTGERVGGWRGADNGAITHLNSCTVQAAQLMCAHSNYPGVPMTSSMERFDTATMTHAGSWSLGIRDGSLTWVDRFDGAWWLTFANYGGDRGHPLHDWRWTRLERFDETHHSTAGWVFPASVLERFAPMSSSGGTWGADGLLYVSGHDHRELYVLALPDAGSVLEHIATIAIPTAGQAFDLDPDEARLLYSVNRGTREVVVTRLPPVRTGH